MTKVAIVTGGSKGIGLAIVKGLISQGYQVYNLDIVSGDTQPFIRCDITNSAEVTAAVKQVILEAGRIDTLICNAGIHYSANIENTTEDELDRVMAINVKGAYSVIRACLPTMKSQQDGSIVLIGSDQCHIAKPNSFAYNLSKHALASMGKTTAIDYADFNIRANVVCAGTTETPLYHQAIDNYCARSGANKEEVHKEEAALQPLGRIAQPEEVADLVIFLAGDKARFITGSLYNIDGGYTTR
ncbi:SDR family NAD(P)-dependent oxidoreductase [Veronia pacifica]|uniref:Oxidoreductase n=1 Tax=Veronia pacifica TaxID=1080227 RepID=A0A1C3ELY9_9GAMM|nr:SDR family oxidoreductase [Veronia pacifica]ODA34240.1 oxidoreductase [Veronia pacifica]